MKRTPSAPNATLTMRSATVSRVLVGHVNADVNVPTTQVRVVSRPITPRHVVRCRVFDATSFTSRQHRSRWFEPTAALRDGVETGQSGGLGVSLRAPGGHSRVTHSRNPADTGGAAGIPEDTTLGRFGTVRPRVQIPRPRPKIRIRSRRHGWCWESAGSE